MITPYWKILTKKGLKMGKHIKIIYGFLDLGLENIKFQR